VFVEAAAEERRLPLPAAAAGPRHYRGTRSVEGHAARPGGVHRREGRAVAAWSLQQRAASQPGQAAPQPARGHVACQGAASGRACRVEQDAPTRAAREPRCLLEHVEHLAWLDLAVGAAREPEQRRAQLRRARGVAEQTAQRVRVEHLQHVEVRIG
jgi:hypothetical protein